VPREEIEKCKRKKKEGRDRRERYIIIQLGRNRGKKRGMEKGDRGRAEEASAVRWETKQRPTHGRPIWRSLHVQSVQQHLVCAFYDWLGAKDGISLLRFDKELPALHLRRPK
jgi:hypothetical protein